MDLKLEIECSNHKYPYSAFDMTELHHLKVAIGQLKSCKKACTVKHDSRSMTLEVPPEDTKMVTPIRPSLMACKLNASNSDALTKVSSVP